VLSGNLEQLADVDLGQTPASEHAHRRIIAGPIRQRPGIGHRMGSRLQCQDPSSNRHSLATPHGGGYDDLVFVGGRVNLVASNPTLSAVGVNVFPALVAVTLHVRPRHEPDAHPDGQRHGV